MPSIVLEVMQHCKLHGAQRAVISTLAAYVDTYGNGVFPSLLTLAQDADISERHLVRCLKQLAKNGYLTIAQRKEPGKHLRNVYTLLFPWRLPAHKFTDKPAHKFTDIRCQSKDLKTQDKEREKRSGSTDMPRNIPPEVLNQPNGPDEVQRWLTPGSEPYILALGGHTPPPVPALRPAPWNTGPTIAHHFQLMFIIARFPDDPEEQDIRIAALRRCLRQRYLEAASAAEGKGCLLG